MDQIAKDFKEHGVVFFMLYTREPHAGQKMGRFDFGNKKQTKTREERVDYALEMMKEYAQVRPILVDTFGPSCIQKTLGGSKPNSLVVIDQQGRLVLWQTWSNAGELRKKLEEMTGAKPATTVSSTDESPQPRPGMRPGARRPGRRPL